MGECACKASRVWNHTARACAAGVISSPTPESLAVSAFLRVLTSRPHGRGQCTTRRRKPRHSAIESAQPIHCQSITGARRMRLPSLSSCVESATGLLAMSSSSSTSGPPPRPPPPSPVLLSPYKMGSFELKNRVVMGKQEKSMWLSCAFSDAPRRQPGAPLQEHAPSATGGPTHSHTRTHARG